MVKTIFTFLFLLLSVSQIAFAEISLEDLSFKKEEITVDPKIASMNETRKSKLQIHQKLGLATMAAMTATLVLAEEAKGMGSSYDNNNLHKYVGIASSLMYWTTAYYSLSAPKPESIKDTGSTRIHKGLAWVHAPLMAIVPVLGYLHSENNKDNKKSTGIVKEHQSLASVAYGTFMAAGLVMYFDF